MTINDVRERMARERVHTAAELAAAGCAVPGCAHEHPGKELYLHGRCHPGAAAVVVHLDGKLLVACDRCGKSIALFEVK